MANLNRIILIGRLTADPEVGFTTDGTPLTKFQLAVERNIPSAKDGNVDFIDIVSWRKLAEICGQYLKKGRLVLIEGSIQTRNYEGQDGQRHYVTEVVARNMRMLEKKANVGAAAEKEDIVPDIGGEEPADDLMGGEDLPF